MSTFDGVVKEYPLISIDNFVEQCHNFKSTVFFLSHCHSDHMRGLGSENFFELLETRGFSNIYLSDVSEHLLKNDDRYSHLSSYLVSLPLEEPTIIVIPDDHGSFHSRVVITLLSAGHCPGSVMILMEGENGRVLYTGDFRLPIGGSARLTNLHDENGGLKPLDSLYIDTTFCQRKCLYIPTREQCLDAIFSLVEPWLANGPNHIVCFSCPAQYAYEFVFVELYRKLGEKTHVTEEKLRKYKGIKFIEDAVTSIPTEARIHECSQGNASLFQQRIYIAETPCGFHTSDLSPIKVMLIRPSAMFFGQNNFAEIIQFDHSRQMHRVCYSTHSSLAEIRDMVKYLKPKIVYPNVVWGQSVEEILSLIHASVLSEDSPYSTQSLLGSLKNLCDQDNSVTSSDDLPFYDECYEVPRKLQPADIVALTTVNPVNQILSDILGSEKSKSSETSMLHCENVQNDCILESQMLKYKGASKLEWDFPLFSSDDENLDPNSFNSSKEKSDSDITPGNSEEQNLKVGGTLLTSPESKILETAPSPNFQNTKNEVLRYVHKINKETTSCDFVNESKESVTTKVTEMDAGELHPSNIETSENPLNQIVESYKKCHDKIKTFCNDINNYDSQNKMLSHKSSNYMPCEKPTGGSQLASTVANNYVNTFPINHGDMLHKNQSSSYSTVIVSRSDVKDNQETSGTPDSIAQYPQYKSNSMASWRNNKLLLDAIEIENSSPSPFPEIEPLFVNRKLNVIGKCTKDDFNEEYQSSDYLLFFSKTSKCVAEQHQKSSVNYNAFRKSDNLTESLVSEKPVDNNVHSSHSLNKAPILNYVCKQNKILRSKAGITTVNQKSELPFGSKIQNKASLLTKYDTPVSSLFIDNSFKTSSSLQISNTIDMHSSQNIFFPNPHRDVSASKFEKSLAKVKKIFSDLKFNTKETDDVLVLNSQYNKRNSDIKAIDVIDLSSDDSFEEIYFLGEISASSKKTPGCSNKVHSNVKHPQEVCSRDLSDSEILDDSPSLLTLKDIPKDLLPSAKLSSDKLCSGTLKRKSDENEFLFRKFVRTETSSDLPVECCDDLGIDSTPEDLFPIRKSQGSYSKTAHDDILCISDDS